MNIRSFTFNPFMENTYVLWNAQNEAIIIDPGCYEPFEKTDIIQFIEENSLTISALVNTHCHIDHVLGNDSLKDHFKVKLYVPENEEDVYRAIPAYAPSYGFTGYREAEVDVWYGEGLISFGNLELEMIEVPGHSPGHMVFYSKPDKILIGGDVLFKQSIGRTDLPGGNHEDLLRNIKEKVYILPDDVTVYPGHGPETTIGFEKKHNPFVRG